MGEEVGTGWLAGGHLVVGIVANSSKERRAGHEIEKENRKMDVRVFTWLRLLCLKISTW